MSNLSAKDLSKRKKNRKWNWNWKKKTVPILKRKENWNELKFYIAKIYFVVVVVEMKIEWKYFKFVFNRIKYTITTTTNGKEFKLCMRVLK